MANIRKPWSAYLRAYLTHLRVTHSPVWHPYVPDTRLAPMGKMLRAPKFVELVWQTFNNAATYF